MNTRGMMHRQAGRETMLKAVLFIGLVAILSGLGPWLGWPMQVAFAQEAPESEPVISDIHYELGTGDEYGKLKSVRFRIDPADAGPVGIWFDYQGHPAGKTGSLFYAEEGWQDHGDPDCFRDAVDDAWVTCSMNDGQEIIQVRWVTKLHVAVLGEGPSDGGGPPGGGPGGGGPGGGGGIGGPPDDGDDVIVEPPPPGGAEPGVPASGVIEGQVTLQGGGPVAGARVILDGEQVVVTAADGTYRVDGLAWGEHRVSVDPAGHRVVRTIVAGQELAASAARVVLSDLRPVIRVDFELAAPEAGGGETPAPGPGGPQEGDEDFEASPGPPGYGGSPGPNRGPGAQGGGGRLADTGGDVLMYTVAGLMLILMGLGLALVRGRAWSRAGTEAARCSDDG